MSLISLVPRSSLSLSRTRSILLRLLPCMTCHVLLPLIYYATGNNMIIVTLKDPPCHFLTELSTPVSQSSPFRVTFAPKGTLIHFIPLFAPASVRERKKNSFFNLIMKVIVVNWLQDGRGVHEWEVSFEAIFRICRSFGAAELETSVLTAVKVCNCQIWFGQ